jgi:uncharacterized coiled-coil protein SlyX
MTHLSDILRIYKERVTRLNAHVVSEKKEIARLNSKIEELKIKLQIQEKQIKEHVHE